MKIKDKLKQVFQETFLNLFAEETGPSDELEAAVEKAREEVETATDALAAYMVTHLRLQEEYDRAHNEFDELSAQLETAIADEDDDSAREFIRQRIVLKKDFIHLDERLANSNCHKEKLKEQLLQMKTQLLEMQQKQLDLKLRHQAATSIEKMTQAQGTLNQQHADLQDSHFERETLLKETVNMLDEQGLETLDARMNALLEDDEIEQELAQLKNLKHEQ